MSFEYEIIKLFTYFGSVMVVSKFLPQILLKKYKLKNYNLVSDISKIELPPELFQLNYSLDEQKIRKKKYSKELLEISNKILNILPDTKFFLRSINDVKIKKLKDRNTDKNSIVIKKGAYSVKRNIICVENPIYLSHEIFHLASSYFDFMNDILYSGFSQINNITKTTIGKGLNEGYTALLDEKYFKSKPGSYVLEKHFANILEMIVGKEKMLKFYCTADLKGLIVELSKYDKPENIIKFINDFEFLEASKVLTLDKNFINEKLQFIAKFLTECYLNKMISDIPFDIPMKYITFSMINFFEKIGTGFAIKDKEFSYFESDYLENLLDRIFKDKQYRSKKIIFFK